MGKKSDNKTKPRRLHDATTSDKGGMKNDEPKIYMIFEGD